MPVDIFYPSQAGGPATIVHYVIKHLDPERFEAIVVSTDKGLRASVSRNRWRDTEGGRVKFVKTRSSIFPLRAIANSLLRLRGADIAHASSVFFPAAFVSIFAGCLLGKKIVVSPQGEFYGWALSRSKWRKQPVLMLYRFLLARRCIFHSTCDSESDYISKQFNYPVRIVQIPNFIETPEMVDRDAQDYLLFVGRLHPIKGIDRLLKALALSSRFSEASFVLKIAGQGQKGYLNKLKKLVRDLGLADKVQFLGQVEDDEKHKLYADAYWTFMPSHTENFGMVVLESLAQNTPVLASKGTPWKILEDEKVGFWIENSPESLAQKIDEILTMPSDEYEAYRARGRHFVRDRFDVRNNIHIWEEFYQNL